MINIQSKYKPGDSLYTIVQVPIKKERTCDLCDGTAKIMYGKALILCPKCKGRKLFLDTGYFCWDVLEKPSTITSIRVKYHNEKNYTLRYNVGGYKRAEEHLFLTKEEAIAACNELNHAILENNTAVIKHKHTSKNLFNIDTKFNIGDNVYTLKKNFKEKTNEFFSPIKETVKIDSIRATIYGFGKYEIRYKLGKLARQESRVFSNLEDTINKCNDLNTLN